MQMMPMMLNKVHQYGQIIAISALRNAGLLGPAPMMQSMPMMPCCIPPSFNMPMAAPMMAAASPLPVAFNPLVQGMYPMASMNPVNWMTPASFMSALSSGPMPYRPPAFDFPNNVGMVMTVPYGTPNPFLSASSFGGFNSSYNFGGGSSWCCCCYCAPPTFSFYPRPVSVPQPYPVPYSAPVAIPNVQQIPVPRPVSVVAPPIVACGNQSLPVSAGAPLWSSQGVVTNGGFSQPAVMASNQNPITQTLISNQPVKRSLPVYDATDQSQRLMGQQITSNLPNIRSDNNQYLGITPSAAKNTTPFSQSHDSLSDRLRRHIPSIIPRLSRSNYNLTRSEPRSDPQLPPILRGQLISDSGWLPKTSKSQTITSILSGKKRKRLYTTDIGKTIFNPRHHRSSSSTSEYDCAICQQQREKRRLREHYGSSTMSSLLSSPKGSRKNRFSSNESTFSSITHTPNSFKQNSYKSHRRHPTRIKIKSKSPSPKQSTSPVLLRQSPIQEQRLNETIHEEEEEVEQKQEQENVEIRSVDDNDSIIEKADRYQSKTSLRSTDE
jgi:hypothetical protein